MRLSEDLHAQVLRLTESQAEQLLELRKAHLRNLRALFEDRQRLNLQVCPLLRRRPFGSPLCFL